MQTENTQQLSYHKNSTIFMLGIVNNNTNSHKTQEALCKQ